MADGQTVRGETYSREHLPTDPATWPTWRKTAVTSAVRIHGPFAVETSEGPLHCEDGFLAIDARGYPYPIAVDEFALIYELVHDPDPTQPAPGYGP